MSKSHSSWEKSELQLLETLRGNHSKMKYAELTKLYNVEVKKLYNNLEDRSRTPVAVSTQLKKMSKAARGKHKLSQNYTRAYFLSDAYAV
jgi:hypothetical protein